MGEAIGEGETIISHLTPAAARLGEAQHGSELGSTPYNTQATARSAIIKQSMSKTPTSREQRFRKRRRSKRKIKERDFKYLITLGRDQLLSQEGQNREFSDKALRIIWYSGLMAALSLAIARDSFKCVAGDPFSAWPAPEAFSVFLVFAQFGLFILVAFYARKIVLTAKWRQSPSMSAMRKRMNDNRPDDDVLKWLGNRYEKAVDANWDILGQSEDGKGKALNKMAKLAFVQVPLLPIQLAFSIF